MTSVGAPCVFADETEALRALTLAGDVRQAESAARALLASNPTHAEAALHLVSAIRWQRDPARYQEAIELGIALMNRAGARPCPELWELMCAMHFELGQHAEACRVKFRAVYAQQSPRIWTGQALARKTLLVLGHPTPDIAGELVPFGQVCRLAAARILWRTPDLRWKPLFERSDRRVSVIGTEARVPANDHYVAHVDLLARTLKGGRLVRPDRYLTPDPKTVARWRAQLPAGPLLGLAWRGGRPGLADYRTPPLKAFGALAGLPVTFVCLQYGDVAADLAALEAMGLNIVKPEGFDPLRSIDDAAALTDACDLVVTVDQSAAHIAGALGKPTFMLSAFYCHFTAYGPPGRSVFYPSLRVLTQARLGEWGPVFEDLRGKLIA
jgi:hypothetical protein